MEPVLILLSKRPTVFFPYLQLNVYKRNYTLSDVVINHIADVCFNVGLGVEMLLVASKLGPHLLPSHLHPSEHWCGLKH